MSRDKLRNVSPQKTEMKETTEADSEWFEWWVNPSHDGSKQADPADLAQMQAYIKRHYTPEIQAKIQIKVKQQRKEE